MCFYNDDPFYRHFSRRWGERLDLDLKTTICDTLRLSFWPRLRCLESFGRSDPNAKCLGQRGTTFNNISIRTLGSLTVLSMPSPPGCIPGKGGPMPRLGKEAAPNLNLPHVTTPGPLFFAYPLSHTTTLLHTHLLPTNHGCALSKTYQTFTYLGMQPCSAYHSILKCSVAIPRNYVRFII